MSGFITHATDECTIATTTSAHAARNQPKSCGRTQTIHVNNANANAANANANAANANANAANANAHATDATVSDTLTTTRYGISIRYASTTTWSTKRIHVSSNDVNDDWTY